ISCSFPSRSLPLCVAGVRFGPEVTAHRASSDGIQCENVIPSVRGFGRASAVLPIIVATLRENGGLMLVAGVDSSTQSTKIVLCRAGDGTILEQRSAPHPAGTEVDPAAWWTALEQAGDGLLSQAAAIGVAGQQHGMIVLDRAWQVIRPALLWNDL